MADPLYMVRGDIDAAALIRRGRRQGLPLRDVDLGYLTHASLEATFGPATLRPFSVEQVTGGKARVWAYSQLDAKQLRSHADAFADPSDHQAWDWDALASKPMPTRFEEGRRLGFRARLCPTVRLAKGDGRHRAGQEIDTFLAACSRAGEGVPVDRSDTYRQWLSDHLDRRGAARLEDARMVEFQLPRMLRRTQGSERKARRVTLPDVVLEGTVLVRDAEAFGQVLRRGLGRHKAFGFGMLLLRRPA